MLKPAICYKEYMEKELAKKFYTEDMLYYTGCLNSQLLKIEESGKDGFYQWAVLDNKEEKVIGYITYSVDYFSSSAYEFGAFSFDKGNVIMGKELFNLLEKLIQSMHRVEFRAISGNKATRGYDNFLERHKEIGTKHILKDVFRDTKGNYHDVYIYEFVNSGF